MEAGTGGKSAAGVAPVELLLDYVEAIASEEATAAESAADSEGGSSPEGSALLSAAATEAAETDE